MSTLCLYIQIKEGDTQMPTLNDVYRKFGEASEAAQLLETQLGTLLLAHRCIDAGLLDNPDPSSATAIYNRVNKETLGQLIQSLHRVGTSIVGLEQLLSDALVSTESTGALLLLETQPQA